MQTQLDHIQGSGRRRGKPARLAVIKEGRGPAARVFILGRILDFEIVDVEFVNPDPIVLEQME